MFRLWGEVGPLTVLNVTRYQTNGKAETAPLVCRTDWGGHVFHRRLSIKHVNTHTVYYNERPVRTTGNGDD
jgi:hypothetical protein